MGIMIKKIKEEINRVIVKKIWGQEKETMF